MKLTHRLSFDAADPPPSPLGKGGGGRKAVILPVVLFVLVLIGLLAAMFSFRVHADLSATQAVAMRLQTRLAAEAGVEYAKMVLRDSRLDRNVWYHDPEIFNRIIVTAHGYDAQIAGTNQEFDEPFGYRFSIVADDPTDDKDYIRFGITDESSKLNLNTATEDQLYKIVSLALGEDTQTDPQLLVDAILDWRDGDNEPRGEAGDTESVYYQALPKPYRVKNGPFDTLEELLLVKGITPAVLYGEDFDRNGLITENEMDGDRSFPDDNQDEILNRGLYGYLTVLSEENNVANSNRPRIYLKGKEEVVRPQLAAVFPDEPGVVDYILQAVKAAGQQGQGDQNGQGGQGGGPGAGGGQGQPGGGAQAPGGPQPQRQGRPRGGLPGAPGAGQRPGQPAQPSGTGPGTTGTDPGEDKSQRRQQARNPQEQPGSGSRDEEQPPGQEGPGPQGAQPPAQQGQQPGSEQPPTGQEGQEGQPDGSGEPQQGEENQDQDENQDEEVEQSEDAEGEPVENPPLANPASLMLPRKIDGQMTPSPLTVEHLAVLMDQTTTVDPRQRIIPGLININTAPAEILECIPGLTPTHVEAILAARDGLDAVSQSTTAWLISEGIMDVVDFEKVASHITARGQQFTIESVGYADHAGMVTRLQVVVDLNGPIAQTIYYRDISNLGSAYPIREEDKEKIRGR